MQQSPLEAPPLPAILETPCGIALLDSENRIEWVNDQFARLLGSSPDLLTGLAAEELPGNGATLLRNDQERLQWPVPEGTPLWLRVERHPAGDKSLVLACDVTAEENLRSENRQLRQQIQDLKLTDDLTGLPNRRAISQALDLQISRSRRYRNPLSIVLVHIGVADEQLELIQGSADSLVLTVSRFLRDRLRWVDQIGRWDENIFLLVLPETEKEDAEGLVNKISTEAAGLQLPPPLEEVRPLLGFGIGVWRKGDDLRTLLRSATQDLAAE